jgi:hypothetical protein
MRTKIARLSTAAMETSNAKVYEARCHPPTDRSHVITRSAFSAVNSNDLMRRIINRQSGDMLHKDKSVRAIAVAALAAPGASDFTHRGCYRG